MTTESRGHIVLAIDPGSVKCGLALADKNGTIVHRSIVPTEELVVTTQSLCARFLPKIILVGNGTGSKPLIRALQDANLPVLVEVVEEHHTTEAARARYVAENPVRGWQRLLPHSLRTPPEPVDDYVAVILAERYWQARKDREVNEVPAKNIS